MKQCFKCGQTKPLSGFHRHSKMADGHLNKCKVCVIVYVHQHRKENLERIQAYDRERGQSPLRKKANIKRYRKRVSTKAGKARELEKAAQWRETRKLERSVYSIVWHAIKSGRVVQQSCVKCGHKNAEAHHEDYCRPLDITWLCKPCHGARHRELNEQRRS